MDGVTFFCSVAKPTEKQAPNPFLGTGAELELRVMEYPRHSLYYNIYYK
jgi:hypothetical protein